MVNIPRIHCHSAFKHYEMFHCNQSSGYGNSVFNTTYNFNGGSMCGGGFWGGLLGGFGMGLGASLMNFLGGGMGMFGGGMGMFGGFSPFGMFGGGFSPMTSWFSPRRTQTDGAGGKEQETKDINCGGKDAEYLHTLRERLGKIKEASEPSTAAKDLYNDIIAVIEHQKDDQHDDADEKNYKDLKADLEKEWEFQLDNDNKATNATAKSSNKPAVNPSAEAVDASPAQTAPAQQSDNNGTVTAPAPVEEGNEEFLIGDKKIKLDDITEPDHIRGLTKQQAQKIGKNNATEILKKLRITPNSEIKKCAGIEEVLLLLEVANISVKIAYNEEDKTVSDHWIKGKIINVEKDDKGKLNYKIDCSTEKDAEQGNTYTVKQQNENKFRFSIEHNDFGKGVSLADNNTPYVEYEFISGHDSLYRNGPRYTTKRAH